MQPVERSSLQHQTTWIMLQDEGATTHSTHVLNNSQLTNHSLDDFNFAWFTSYKTGHIFLLPSESKHISYTSTPSNEAIHVLAQPPFEAGQMNHIIVKSTCQTMNNKLTPFHAVVHDRSIRKKHCKKTVCVQNREYVESASKSIETN